jgi:hypothetical protein
MALTFDKVFDKLTGRRWQWPSIDEGEPISRAFALAESQ